MIRKAVLHYILPRSVAFQKIFACMNKENGKKYVILHLNSQSNGCLFACTSSWKQ